MEEGYIGIMEATAMIGKSRERARELCKQKLVKSFKDDNGHWNIEKKSLLEYLAENKGFALHDFDDFDEMFKPITSNKLPYEIFDNSRYEFKCQYLISNYGRVYSYAKNIFLQPDIKNGYYYINLEPNDNNEEKDEHNYIHRIVAYFFCPNSKYKKYVHHIDLNKLNNHYKNLIWVTDAEHKELHKLYSTDKKAYKKRIAEIRKENKWR